MYICNNVHMYIVHVNTGTWYPLVHQRIVSTCTLTISQFTHLFTYLYLHTISHLSINENQYHHYNAHTYICCKISIWKLIWCTIKLLSTCTSVFLSVQIVSQYPHVHPLICTHVHSFQNVFFFLTNKLVKNMQIIVYPQ